MDLNIDHGIDNPDGFSSELKDVIMVLFIDGSVRFLDNDTPANIVEALFTRDGGEMIMDLEDHLIDPGIVDESSFEWDLDNNGSFETMGSQPVFDATGLSAGEYPIHFRITSSTGVICTLSSTVMVNNVVPTLSQWGLMILVIFMLIMGLIGLRMRRVRLT